MSSPVFGFVFNQTDTDTNPPVTSDFSILGIVLPSDDATASVFPLNTPVQINTGDPAVLLAAGSGPLYQTLLRINANLADLEVSATAVVVRVPMAYQSDGKTENVAGTIVNIVGDPAVPSGIYALLTAPSLTGFTPRVIGAPGYTGQTSYAVMAPVITRQGSGYTSPVVTFNPAGATATATVSNAGVQAVAHAVLTAGEVSAINVDNAGQDYAAAPAVTITGGGGTGATAHAVLNNNGQVGSIIVDNEGTGYTSVPTVTLAAPAGGEITAITLTSPGNYAAGVTPTISIADSNGGAGSGATATITMEQLENPICAALPAVCNALLAHAIVGGPGTTKAAAIAWRGLIASQRLIPVDNWEIIAAAQGDAYIDGAATVMGLAVRTDFQHGGYPFWSFANQPVQGILGLKRIDALSLLDGSTDGQQLLAIGVGITARGDLADTSIADSGFIHVSWRNAGTDPLYTFYNKTRGRDFTNLALIKAIRSRLGAENITPASVQAVLNDMTALMIILAQRQCVVGYKIGFNAADNSTAGLRAGQFTVFDNSEEPAPILQITINRGLDQNALTTELATLAATSATITG